MVVKLPMETTQNIKIRLRFSKQRTLKFIGHLDFLRVFQQTIRRSGLLIAYSQGFNPHQILSFALPLPLGMESVNDYADINLTAPVALDVMVEKLNQVAPIGLVFSAAYMQTGKAAAAATAIADYAIALDTPTEVLQEKIQALLEMETIVIPKKTKSGVKDTDIRPDIFAMIPVEGGVKLTLSAGSGRFLNPLLVAEQLLGHPVCNATISRLELYQATNEGFIPL